jgi:hypothetical protein
MSNRNSELTRYLIISDFVVNSIPALRYVPEWFPGAGWKREASKWRKEKESLMNETFNIGMKYTARAYGYFNLVLHS